MQATGAQVAFFAILGPILVGVVSAWLARRGSADTSRATVAAAREAAQAGAFQSATEIFRAGADELRAQLDEQRERADELRQQLQRIAADHQGALERIERLESTATGLRSTATAQAEEIRTLRRSVSIYEGRVQQLEAALRVLGAEVPPWNLLPGDADLLGTRTPMDDPNRPPRTEP